MARKNRYEMKHYLTNVYAHEWSARYYFDDDGRTMIKTDLGTRTGDVLNLHVEYENQVVAGMCPAPLAWSKLSLGDMAKRADPDNPDIDVTKKKRVTIEFFIYVRSKRERFSDGCFSSHLNNLNGIDYPPEGFWDYNHDDGYCFSVQAGMYNEIFEYSSDDAFGIECQPNRRLVYLERITVEASVQIDSGTGANPPYILEVWEDVIPYISNPSPAPGAAIDGGVDQALTWKFSYDGQRPGYEKLRQQSAVVRWRHKGERVYTQYLITGEQQSIPVPAHTFGASEIEWQVQVTSDDNITGDPSDWMTFTVTNPTLHAVPEYPVSVFINGDQDQYFKWRTPYSPADEQTAYELQYSEDAGGHWTTYRKESVFNHICMIAGGTFEGGTVWWRVRLTNKAGYVGNWSETAVFVAQAAPVMPVITRATPVPHMTVDWTSSGQMAFRLRVGEFDSGPRYGPTTRTFTIPAYLPPGPYTVRVSIQNVFGTWSEWGEKEVLVENPAGPAIRLSARPRSYDAWLFWRTEGTYAQYYIFRGDRMVGKTEQATFADSLARGRCVYFVRGVTADGHFTDSNKVIVPIKIKCPVIADVTDFAWVPLNRTSEDAQVQTDEEQLVDYKHLAGRTKPVAEISEFVDRTCTVPAAFQDGAGWEKIEPLLGKTVAYKAPSGFVFVGVLGDRSRTESAGGRVLDVTLTLTETDYREDVDYD